MKEYVTIEELNAATLLMTGVPVTQLVEIHVAASSVTAITADESGNLNAKRIRIGAPQTEVVTEELEEDEGEIVEETPKDEEE